MTSTYLINSCDDFHEYYNILKDDATMGDQQKIFVVGFDIEFICKDNYPESFDKSETWVIDNSTKIAACTIQISSKNVCFLINLIKMKHPLPKKLITILTSDSWVKIGIGVDNDMQILSSNYQLGHCSGTIELKSLALMSGHPKPNLEFLYNQFVGGHIKKTNSVHDWSNDLTNEQIKYAAQDAIMSYQLGITLFEPLLNNINKIVNGDISSKLSINVMNCDNSNLHIIDKTHIDINYVGKLQEYLQIKKISMPDYNLENIDDSTHPPIFYISCKVLDYKTVGIDKSKKNAKSNAAEKLLRIINDHCF
jgi:hypothetical protein